VDPFEGLLEKVFGLVAISRHVKQIPQQAVPVPLDQLPKRRTITPKVCVQQAFVCCQIHQGHNSNYR
jgi:hypothetical protein